MADESLQRHNEPESVEGRIMSRAPANPYIAKQPWLLKQPEYPGNKIVHFLVGFLVPLAVYIRIFLEYVSRAKSPLHLSVIIEIALVMLALSGVGVIYGFRSKRIFLAIGILTALFSLGLPTLLTGVCIATFAYG